MNTSTDRYHCWKIPYFLEISLRWHCIPPVGTILSHPASSIARSIFRITVHHKLRTFRINLVTFWINLVNEEKQSPIQVAHKQFLFHYSFTHSGSSSPTDPCQNVDLKLGAYAYAKIQCFLHVNLLWLSIWTVHSSVHPQRNHRGVPGPLVLVRFSNKLTVRATTKRLFQSSRTM